jgi:predicted nucleic acid-binding protein
MDIERTRGLVFLDTNIFFYSFDHTSPKKQTLAQTLIRQSLSTQRGAISTQVVQEFINVALKRFPRRLAVPECRVYTGTVLMPMCKHFPSLATFDHALLLQEETGYSFYDALILAASIELGCTTLLSEDLQDGRTIRGVKIVNPFSKV